MHNVNDCYIKKIKIKFKKIRNNLKNIVEYTKVSIKKTNALFRLKLKVF